MAKRKARPIFTTNKTIVYFIPLIVLLVISLFITNKLIQSQTDIKQYAQSYSGHDYGTCAGMDGQHSLCTDTTVAGGGCPNQFPTKTSSNACSGSAPGGGTKICCTNVNTAPANGNKCGSCTGSCSNNGQFCDQQASCNGSVPIFDVYQCDGSTWVKQYQQQNGSVCAYTCNGKGPSPSLSPKPSGASGGAANTLSLSPANLNFAGAQGSTVTDQSFTIKNTGAQSVTWIAQNNTGGNDWMIIYDSSNPNNSSNLHYSLAAGATATIHIHVTPGSLAPGTYTGTIPFVNQSTHATDATETVTMKVSQGSVKADTGFRIIGVTSTSVANPRKTGTITLNRTDSALPLASTNILGAASYTASGTFIYDPTTHAFVNHNLNLGNLPPGNYILAMHVDGNLDAQMTQGNGSSTVFKISPGQKITTDIVDMIPGDVAPGQGDNFIDIIDYNKLVNCMGQPVSGACQEDDLNDDGKIDQGDLDLLMLHFGSLGYSIQKPGFNCVMDPECQTGQQALQLCTLICTRQQ